MCLLGCAAQENAVKGIEKEKAQQDELIDRRQEELKAFHIELSTLDVRFALPPRPGLSLHRRYPLV